ncbi:MAG: transcription elongation factor GreA [Candidatus Omnitrophica bacterium]|nr:transcription elongation factor GreA [Candidatus Omnitrophota bacterium]
MTEKTILTHEGYNKLVEELNFLKTKKRREVANQLEHARSLGDLRENAEYETAKEAKHQLEIRISNLEAKLSGAQIVDTRDLPTDKVYLGATVEIKNHGTSDKIVYTLVPQDEADFNQGKISITSPIGKGLLGKGVKEVVEIEVPAGRIKLEILKISRG